MKSSDYVSFLQLRTLFPTEAKVQRVLRNYLKSQHSKLNKRNEEGEKLIPNNAQELNENVKLSMAALSRQTKDLRASHLLRSFLRGKTYYSCEQTRKPSTLEPSKLLEVTGAGNRYNINPHEFEAWFKEQPEA
jgi:DNA-binding transcriptional ArsR family regulator